MKKLLCLAFVLVTFIFVNAQELPKIIPPSPSAYELGKYGQSPTGTFTGTANVNIPLYTYKTKKLSVPISLSYNSNGIKVDQLSSNVGLGWSLNAGGVITRIIRDEPDERGVNIYPEEDIEGAPLNDPIAVDYFYKAGQNDIDTELDVYMYNFMGYSGKFMFDTSGEIVLMPLKDLLINNYFTIENGEPKVGFKITTANGVSFLFLSEEYSTLKSSFGGSQNLTNTAPTSWYLTRIEHPSGETIEFVYDDFTMNYVNGVSESITIATPSEQNGCEGLNTSAGIIFEPTITNRLIVAGKRLLQIKSSENKYGEVNFISNTQYPEINSHKMISNLSILDDKQIEVENIDFNYLITSNNRVFLENVIFLNPDKSFQFDYIFPNDFPERLSKSKDFWGYNNGVNNSNHFPNPQNPYIKAFLHSGFTYYDIGADKSIHTSYARKGLLERVTYPTKGYTEFEYESNTYEGEVTVYPNNKEEIILNASVSDNPDDPYNPDDTELSNTILFNHKAELNVSIAGLSTCTPTHEPSVSVSITDNAGDDVIIFERIQDGFVSVGTNSILVKETDLNKKFYVSLIEGHAYTTKIHIHHMCAEASLNFSYYDENISTEIANIKQGGLRIKSTTDYNLNTDKDLYTRYYYGKKESINKSTGHKAKTPSYISKRKDRIGCGEGGHPCEYVDIYHQTLHSNNLRQIYDSSGSNSTYYQYITESLGGDHFENGGVETEFIIHDDFPGNPLHGDPIDTSPWVNLGWGNGLEKKKTYFKKSGQVITTQKEIINTYKEDTRYFKQTWGYTVNKKFDLFCPREILHTCTQDDIEWKVEYFFCTSNHDHIYIGPSPDRTCIQTNNHNEVLTIYGPCRNHIEGDTLFFTDLIENLDIMSYTNNSYWYYLEKTIQRQYDKYGQNPIETVTNYQYDNPEHLQISSKTIEGTNGLIRKSKYFYADDVINLASLGEALTPIEKAAVDSLKTPSIDNLYAQHRISEPIQIETYENGILLSTQRTNYKDWGVNSTQTNNIILPEIMETSKGEQPLEPKITYHKYDAHGNPLEVSKAESNAHIVYIWGYNHTQPIAKIVNATWSEVESHVTNLQLLSNQDDDRTIGSAGNEGALRTALNTLRNALPNTQVTTYTYDPLIGVTSITQPNGETEYYEYDNFNRLKFIKNSEGKILKENEYHYRD